MKHLMQNVLSKLSNRSLNAETLQVARNTAQNAIGDQLINLTVPGMESDAVQIVKWLLFHLRS